MYWFIIHQIVHFYQFYLNKVFFEKVNPEQHLSEGPLMGYGVAAVDLF